MYENFKKILEKKGVTAYRVAKETGLSSVVFTDWKKGKSNPKIDKLQKIAKYFNVPIEYFLEEQEDKQWMM